MSLIMGIDQSLRSTGIVVMNSGIMIHHQIIRTEKNDFENVYARINHIVYEIANIIIEYNIKHANVEGISFGSGGHIADLGGLMHCIVMVCAQSGLTVHVIPPKTLKKAATNSGNADKDFMFAHLPEHERAVAMTYLKSKGRSDFVDAWYLAKCGSEIQ